MKYLLLIVILTGCSVQKRCERLNIKAERLGCIKNDTIIRYDTIKGFNVDTVVQFSDTTLIDTLYFEKDGVKVKTVLKWKDRIVSQTITKQDTILKEVIVNKKVIINKEVHRLNWWQWAIFALIVFGLIFFRR